MQPIILLHGALGAASSLAAFSKHLASLAEAHTLDFSGHGTARWPEEGFSIETFEADVLRLMDTRGIDAAHIFGYSMGGFIGLRLAACIPDRILSVTTLATKMDWTEETCATEARMLEADVMESKVPKFIAALAAIHPQAGWRPVVENTQLLIKNMHRYRFTPEVLQQIQQPVRVMVGDRDKMVSINETIEAYRALPNASLCVLPDTPHPLEAADCHLLAALVGQNCSKAVAGAF